MTLFDNLVIKNQDDNGMWSIDCPVGLWGVNSFSYIEAEREASVYFWQYMQDGEYNHLIKD